jgi:hypothetical protein
LEGLVKLYRVRLESSESTTIESVIVRAKDHQGAFDEALRVLKLEPKNVHHGTISQVGCGTAAKLLAGEPEWKM